METLRKSSYLIEIPLDEQEEKYMLIQGYTGAIDVVNKNIIARLHSTNIESETISPNILNNLIKRGYLTNKSKGEEIVYVQKVSSLLSKKNQLLSKKYFTLVVTYDCNFNCPYCFEKDIMKKENNNGKMTISESMVDRFFKTIKEVEFNEQLRNKTISLFGGEPLLKENRKIVEYIIRKGQENNYTFIATSNGYDLDYYEDLLGNGLIKGIQITLDGTRNAHDHRRSHSIYVHSFDKIINNLKMALKKGVAINVRINIDSDNIDELQKLNNYFNEIELFSFKNFSAYAVYISGEANFSPTTYKQKENTNQQSFLNIFNASNIKIAYEQRIYSFLNNAISKKMALTLTSNYCNAQFGSFVFDPFGYIYSCLEIVGNKDEAIGTYSNGLVWKEKGKDRWFGRRTNSIDTCSKCKYSLLCGGGCFAKAIVVDRKSHCDDFPIRLKSVAQKVYSNLHNENLIDV